MSVEEDGMIFEADSVTAFLGRGALAAPERLEDVIEVLVRFLGPVLVGSVEVSVWNPGGVWSAAGIV